MSLLIKLQEAVQELERNQITYALAGGLVASLYRKEARATADIDLALLTDDEKIAKKILETLHLEVHFLRKASLEGGPAFAIKKQNTPVYILCGRSSNQGIGVDFILSRLSWVKQALERAQANQVDFGFGAIPCITVEDLILSKLTALKNQATRFMDLDDLKSIFESKKQLDWIYLNHQMKRLHLTIPEVLKPFV